MLKTVNRKSHRAGDASFAIVASEYNARYVDAMLRAAKAELKQAGANDVQVIRVPGAYEIPVIVSRLARSAAESFHATRNTQHMLSAIICLGVILRGETAHAAHIGEAVSQALMQIQVRYEIPVIHEVLLLDNEDQARVRCLGKQHSRGAEAAQTALAMARVMEKLNA